MTSFVGKPPASLYNLFRSLEDPRWLGSNAKIHHWRIKASGASKSMFSIVDVLVRRGGGGGGGDCVDIDSNT